MSVFAMHLRSEVHCASSYFNFEPYVHFRAVVINIVNKLSNHCCFSSVIFLCVIKIPLHFYV